MVEAANFDCGCGGVMRWWSPLFVVVDCSGGFNSGGGCACGWSVVFVIVDEEKRRLGGKRERERVLFTILLCCM